MMRQSKAWKAARDATIIAMISLAMIIVLELFLRIVWPDLAGEWNSYTIAFEPNPDYGIRLKANASKEYRRLKVNGATVTRWGTNSQGFRGSELAVDPDYRIVVYGDSNLQARFSNDSETFPVKLSQRLSALTDLAVEVINAGVIGYGPDQSLIQFGLDAGVLKPDLFLLHVFADNDFGDIVRNRLFEMKNGNLVRTMYPIERDQAFDGKTGIAGVLRALRKSSAIGGLVRRLRADDKSEPTEVIAPDQLITQFTDLAKDEWSVYAAGEPRRFSFLADHYDIDIAIAPNSDSAREKLRLMEAVLLRARDAAAERDVALIVFIQPSVVDLSRNFWISYTDLEKFPLYDRTRMSTSVSAICRRHGIDYVNLYPVFRDETPDNLFFKDVNAHWNDAGQELAAHEVADFIIARGLLRLPEASSAR